MALLEYTLEDLQLLARELGVRLPNRCDASAARLVLEPVVAERNVHSQVAQTAFAAALALVAVVQKSCAARDPEGYYAALHIDPAATEDEIIQAHRLRSLQLHEDRHSSAPEEQQRLAKHLQQRVNEAKEILSDNRTRAAYHKQGVKGIARAALVPANLSIREFLNALDLMEKKDALIKAEQEVSSAGTALVRFDISSWLQPATDALHNVWEQVGYDWTHESLFHQEDDEDDDEVDAHFGESDENDSADIDDVEHVSDEEEQEGKAGIQLGNDSIRIAIAHVDGEEKIAFIPNEKLQAHLRKELGNHSNQHQRQKVDPQPKSLHSPSQVILWMWNIWPRYIPHATQLYASHQFSLPMPTSQSLTVSASGPPASVKFLWSWALSSLQKLGASMKCQMHKMNLAFTWFREFTSSTAITLKYKIESAHNNQNWVSGLSASAAHTAKKGRTDAKLSMTSTAENRLTWTYTTSDGEGTASYSTDIGWMTLDPTIISRIPLARRNPCTSEGQDEDEAIAARDFGNLTSSFTQATFTGTSRFSWKAMFFTSKKSTQNQVGFGMMTTLPYSWAGQGWVLAENYVSRTEFQIHVQRYNFNLQIPILVTTAYDGPTVGMYFMAPFFLYKLAQELVIKPWSAVRRHKEHVKRRLASREKLWEDRRQALAVQDLLRAEAKKRLEEELATQGGLVIQNAKYGCLHPQYADSSYGEELPPRDLDVTIALQAKVQQSHLILQAGPKHHYDGFYDVDPEGEEDRYLRVRYVFHDMPHEVEILESMELALPLKEHLVETKAPESPGKSARQHEG